MQTAGLAPARPERLAELDAARALTAVAVVLLHAAGYSLTQDPAGSALQRLDQALVLSLRYARQVFMLLSGFALAYAYRYRPLRYPSFLGRRGFTTALPYLAWSALYLWVSRAYGMPAPAGHPVRAYLEAVLFGTAFYHLYYIVVSLQWYAVFPPVLRAMERLGGRAAGWTAAGVLALFLAVNAWLTAGAPLPGWAADRVGPFLQAHRDHLLLSYLGYFLLGTLAGLHAERVLAWVHRHAGRVWAGTAAILAFLLYGLLRPGPVPFAQAVDVFRPAMLLYGVGAAASLVALSGRIARAPGPLRDGLLALAGESYTVYLAHPLVLFLIEWYLLRPLPWHHPAVSLGLTAAGVLVSLAVARVLAPTPLAPLFLGRGTFRPWPRARRRVRPGRPAPAAVPRRVATGAAPGELAAWPATRPPSGPQLPSARPRTPSWAGRRCQ